jgi:starch phosphorylase
MKALRSFTVRPRLPEPLARLEQLAMNLRWSWDDRARDLFRWLDPDGWEESRHDPVRVLSHVSHARLDELQSDAAFLTFLDEVADELTGYLERPRWFQVRSPSTASVGTTSSSTRGPIASPRGRTTSGSRQVPVRT